MNDEIMRSDFLGLGLYCELFKELEELVYTAWL